MSQAYGSWLLNVTVVNTPNYHVSISDSVQCELRHCYLSTRQGSGSNGAGILMGAASSCLVEDNVVEKVDSDNPAGLEEPPGDGQILFRRGRIP